MPTLLSGQVGGFVTCTGLDQTGVGDGTQDQIVVNNQGTIDVSGTLGGTAVNLQNTNIVSNSGSIIVGDFGGTGIWVTNGNTIINAGSIVVGSFSSAGIDACCDNTIINAGSIIVGDQSWAIISSDRNTITNSGMIKLGDQSFGIIAENGFISAGNNATITNSGSIIGGDASLGIGAERNYNVINSGTINLGFGATGISVNRGVAVTNYGTIQIGAGGIGIELNAFGSGVGNIVANSGSVLVPYGYALYGLSNNTITNTGMLLGSIVLFGSGNTITNEGTIISSDTLTPAGAINVIGGTLINNPTGTIGIRVDPFSNDTYQADTITLNGGRLAVVVMPGLYGASTLYSSSSTSFIAPLQACSCGLTGTFSTVVSSSPFFIATAIYDYGNGEVDIQLDRIALNAVQGLTPNQQSVANALEPGYSTSLTGNAATFYAYLMAATSVNAFDILSGEGTAATQTAAFSASQMFSGTMAGQIMAWLSSPFGGGTGPSAYASDDRKAPPAAFKALGKETRIGGWRAWLAGFFGKVWANGENSPGSADVRASTGGGAFGADYQAAPDLLMGFAAGMSQSNFSVPDRATDGDVVGGHLGAYAAKTWGAFYTSASASYAHFDNTTNRTISVGGATEFAKGNFASDLIGAHIEFGYRTRQGRYDVTPFVAIEPSHLWQRGYTETSFDSTGAPGVFGLTYGSRSVSSLPLFLGAQAETRWVLPNGTLLAPQLRAAWVHEFMPDRDVNAAFISVPNSAFTVQGARPASDSAKINAAARWFFNPQVYLFASLDGEFSDRTLGYSGTAGFKSSW